jgi:hypothetical protein
MSRTALARRRRGYRHLRANRRTSATGAMVTLPAEDSRTVPRALLDGKPRRLLIPPRFHNPLPFTRLGQPSAGIRRPELSAGVIMRSYRAAGAVLGLLAAGCATQGRADKVMTRADSAVTAQHVDAIRFAPEAFQGVMTPYNAARKAYGAKDWRGAIKAGQEAITRAGQLGPAIEAGRTRAIAEWPARRDSTRAMLDLLASRLAEWTRTRHFPSDLSADKVHGMQLTVDTLDTGLDNAQKAFAGGDVSGAVHALDRVQQRIASIMQASGVAPRPPHGG